MNRTLLTASSAILLAFSASALTISSPSLADTTLSTVPAGEAANNKVYQPDKSTTNDGTNMSTVAGKSDLKNADESLNASELIGLKVRNAQNETVGKISEVLFERTGKADGVIVDVGGILGVGAHPVRLTWKDIALHADGSDNYATISISKNRLKQLPAAK